MVLKELLGQVNLIKVQISCIDKSIQIIIIN